MRELPNENIGRQVCVTLSESSWAYGTVQYGDATVVKVNFDEYPDLNGFYPTADVELLERRD